LIDGEVNNFNMISNDNESVQINPNIPNINQKKFELEAPILGPFGPMASSVGPGNTNSKDEGELINHGQDGE